MQRPDRSEYHEYYHRYVARVPEGPILELLVTELERTLAVLRRVPLDQADHRYQVDKWSIKEVIGHVIDSERAFAYRAFSFARADPARLPSFEQDDYARYSNASRRSLADLAEELASLRNCNRLLFNGLDDAMWARRGIASEVAFTVRSLPYIIVGHEMHHRSVLEERYLPSVLAGNK